jgi:hypothetical protein
LNRKIDNQTHATAEQHIHAYSTTDRIDVEGKKFSTHAILLGNDTSKPRISDGKCKGRKDSAGI